jgi:hypothetical protein
MALVPPYRVPGVPDGEHVGAQVLRPRQTSFACPQAKACFVKEKSGPHEVVELVARDEGLGHEQRGADLRNVDRSFQE